MARPPAYYLYSDGRKTMHASNSLQALIERARLLSKVLGGRYLVTDIYGNVVWEEDEK